MLIELLQGIIKNSSRLSQSIHYRGYGAGGRISGSDDDFYDIRVHEDAPMFLFALLDALFWAITALFVVWSLNLSSDLLVALSGLVFIAWLGSGKIEHSFSTRHSCVLPAGTTRIER